MKTLRLIAVAVLMGAAIQTAYGLAPVSRTSTSQYGMVAAAHPLAVEAGLRMMEKGGNAVDAAAAVAFAVGVAEPFGSGIGGDGIAMIYIASENKVDAFEYRCAAPMAATRNTYPESTRSEWTKGGKSFAVPGLIAGTCAFHEQYGQLSLAEVMQPAIDMAENGYAVGPALSKVISDSYDKIAANPEMVKMFLVEEFPPEVGQRLRNPMLAKTLRLIAENGPEIFYGGPIGEQFVAGTRGQGSLITLDDLKAYKARRTEALSIDYRGMKIYAPTMPMGGIGVLLNLNLIERLPLDIAAGASSPQNLHLMAEAMKLGSRDRYAVSGDPMFTKIPTEWLLSDEYSDQRAKLVNPSRALTVAEIPVGPVDQGPGSTTHFTIMDAKGNAVSITQTLGGYFGVGVTAPGLGIVLNDQMKNFSPSASSPNALYPGKRMNSTQSPVIVTKDGQSILAMGSPGNYRITTTVTEVLVNILDFGLPLQEALDIPRISALYRDEILEVESGFSAETLAALAAKGHKVNKHGEMDMFFGGVHAVARDPKTGLLTGAADARRDGVSKGLAEPPKATATR